MSCDSSFRAFCGALCVSGWSISEQLGDGDPRRAAALLLELSEIARSRAEAQIQARPTIAPDRNDAQARLAAAQARAADAEANELTRQLFREIDTTTDRDGRPLVSPATAHGSSGGLPASQAARYGYAVVMRTLSAVREARPLPNMVRDIQDAQRARAVQTATQTPPIDLARAAVRGLPGLPAVANGEARTLSVQELIQLSQLADQLADHPGASVELRQAAQAMRRAAIRFDGTPTHEVRAFAGALCLTCGGRRCDGCGKLQGGSAACCDQAAGRLPIQVSADWVDLANGVQRAWVPQELFQVLRMAQALSADAKSPYGVREAAQALLSTAITPNTPNGPLARFARAVCAAAGVRQCACGQFVTAHHRCAATESAPRWPRAEPLDPSTLPPDRPNPEPARPPAGALRRPTVAAQLEPEPSPPSTWVQVLDLSMLPPGV